MEVLHPRTGKWYTYAMLPMGTRASPGVACRFGAGFLWTVVEGHHSYQGRPDFAADLRGTKYRSSLGTGQAEIGKDGLGVNFLFMHVDDIFLHSPTLEKMRVGLDHSMNTTVCLGLICQPIKTKPSFVGSFTI